MEADPMPRVSKGAERQRKKKTPNACVRCRNRKIRCSGHQPCEQCAARNERCLFEEKERRTLVSQDYLEGLQNRLQALESQPAQTALFATPVSKHLSQHELIPSSETPAAMAESLSPQTEVPVQNRHAPPACDSLLDNENLTNSLVASEPQIRSTKNGIHRYLGHSSSLCFSQNVRNLLYTSTVVASPGSARMEREDTSYQSSYPPINLDLSNIDLPSYDFAEYLTSTVSFYAEPLYHLFDKKIFLHRLREFYDGRNAAVYQRSRLWHVQMLLVFALGKSILAREHFESGPSGSSFFARAMDALPDIRCLHECPILAIEILCLITLFMHATDMLQEAYIYIGQALRLSVLQRLNRDVQDESLRPPDYEHRALLWWTVYCIDRKNAALLGTPSVIRDDDISLPMPKPARISSSMPPELEIHISLSSQLGRILDVLYGVRGQWRRHFVHEVQSILSNLAETSDVLTQHLRLELQRPIDIMSRKAATLHLLVHQCVILAVRPVLYSLLRVRLSSPTLEHLPGSVDGLLRVCVESSISTLKIMFALKLQTQCDLFLPYDVEALFSATFALVIIDILKPARDLLWDLPQALKLLDEFISRGIAPAKSFKADLIELLELHGKVRRADAAVCGNDPSLQNQDHAAGCKHHAERQRSSWSAEEDGIWSWIMHDDGEVGAIHPNTITSAIDSLNTNELEMTDASLLNGDWLWGFDAIPGLWNA